MPAETPLRLLCAEDDPDIRMILEVAFAAGGFEAEICASGRQALQRLAITNPDLIVLDVMMPALDGPSTLIALRRMPHAYSTPVVFLTAKVRPQDIEEYLALGAAAVIPKPFDPVGLPDRIRAIWRQCAKGAQH